MSAEIVNSSHADDAIERLIGLAIKVSAIEAGWSYLMCMAASILKGALPPSIIRRKLSAYRRQNKLDLALRELGRDVLP